MTEVAGIRNEIVGKLEQAMAERGLDALVATSPENVAWASGAAPPAEDGRSGSPRRSCRARARASSSRSRSRGPRAAAVAARLDPAVRGVRRGSGTRVRRLAAAARAGRGRGRGRGDAPSQADYGKLAAALPAARLVRADELLEELRMVKTPSEIEAIRDIGGAAERIAGEVCERSAPARPSARSRTLSPNATRRRAATG